MDKIEMAARVMIVLILAYMVIISIWYYKNRY